MQCTSCRLESTNLRPYLHLHGGGAGRTVHLCAACRVLNALHPQYVASPANAAAVAAASRAARADGGDRTLAALK